MLLYRLISLALLLPAAALADCGAPATAISAVQGTGDHSAMVGQTVTVEGVVTLDARGPGGFGGFYLQQPQNQWDDNPASSEALFVYTKAGKLSAGSRVRVSGTVKEFHGLTELVKARVVAVCGAAELPRPVRLTELWPQSLPAEALENMRVTLALPLTVIDNYQLARYGELTLAPERQWIPTQRMAPGPAAHERFQAQERQRLTLDDGRGARDPRPVPYPAGGLDLASGTSVRAGNRVTELDGVLDFRFGQWRLQPVTQPRFEIVNPRPQAPAAPAAGNLRVASFNLGNYFNGDGTGSFESSRGADNSAEFSAQTARLKAAIGGLQADVLAVMELENDGYGTDSALASLAGALGEPWRAVRADGRTGRDAIRVGLLYRADRVEPVGPVHVQPASHSGRPALAQAFRSPAGPESFRVAAVHFKSKNCRNASGADRDQNDGQGCYAATRRQAARGLADWLAELPKPSGHLGNLIAGDLNSYAREWPLLTLADAGFVDLVRRHRGDTAYTYQYRGRAGTLDYLLADDALAERSSGARTWGINADETVALAYDRLPMPAAGRPVPWRSSDHDPLFTDLRLNP